VQDGPGNESYLWSESRQTHIDTKMRSTRCSKERWQMGAEGKQKQNAPPCTIYTIHIHTSIQYKLLRSAVGAISLTEPGNG